jgi:hypothetical protein
LAALCPNQIVSGPTLTASSLPPYAAQTNSHTLQSVRIDDRFLTSSPAYHGQARQLTSNGLPRLACLAIAFNELQRVTHPLMLDV